MKKKHLATEVKSAGNYVTQSGYMAMSPVGYPTPTFGSVLLVVQFAKSQVNHSSILVIVNKSGTLSFAFLMPFRPSIL